MITRKGIWLNFNQFKFINGQTVSVIPNNYLNEELDKEVYPFKAYILARKEGKDLIVYSYIKESELRRIEEVEK